jgi:branched-chain amino acid transport system substrate-binding protein
MPSRRQILVATPALLGAPAILRSGRAWAADRVIHIGYELPLTGQYSDYGIRFRNSAMLAMDEFKAASRLPGAEVTIVYEDTQSEPREATTVAQKFVDDSQMVGVLGDFSSGASMAAGQVYARVGMPQLSQTASHPDYTKISKWQFRNIVTQAYEAPYEARWMIANGLKRAAVVCIQNDWGQSVASNFADGFKKGGGEIVTTEFSNPGNREFRSILTKVARQQPDSLFIGMFYEDGAALLQQRSQLGLDMPAYGAGSLYEPKLVELAGAAANGLKLDSSFVANSPDPKVQAYVKAYEQRYGNEPNMFSAQAYDAVNIMLAAIVRAGTDVTRSSLRDALAATKDFPGVTGSTTFDPKTRECEKELVKMEIKDGKFVVVES